MHSVFVIITKVIASENYFCKEVFCNNFGRDGTAWPVFPVLVFQLSNRTVLGQPPQPYLEPSKPYSDKETPLRRASRRLLC